MRKQTIQPGRGLEYMKGISEAPVVLGTCRRAASSNWKSKPTILQSLRWESSSMAVALRKHTGSLFQFQSPLQVFHFTPQLSLRNNGQLPNIKGFINLSYKKRLQFSKSYNHLEQKHCGGSFKSNTLRFPIFQSGIMFFYILATFSTVLSPLCPYRVNQSLTYSACSSNPRSNPPLWQTGKILKTQNN